MKLARFSVLLLLTMSLFTSCSKESRMPASIDSGVDGVTKGRGMNPDIARKEEEEEKKKKK
ncbi:hypothetical protein OAK75_02455 [Bacteriovoracales bacterium]|nr:hypothetical protein [Bacteriovoracales bacterium]